MPGKPMQVAASIAAAPGGAPTFVGREREIEAIAAAAAGAGESAEASR